MWVLAACAAVYKSYLTEKLSGIPFERGNEVNPSIKIL